MALDQEDAPLSLIQRLEAAKLELQEQNNGKSKSRVSRSGSRAVESGGSALDRTVRSAKARTNTAATGDRDLLGSSRTDERPLGVDRKGDGSFSPTRGRVPRDGGGVTQANRQNAGQAPLLKAKDQAIATIKRALIYAGFDLKGDAKALKPDEIEKYKPKVAEFFKRLGIALDWSITHSNKAHAESEIWVFDDEEAEKLADIYLKRAKKIGWMAEVARQVEHIENIGDGADVAAILGKRLVATGMFYPSNGGIELWLQ